MVDTMVDTSFWMGCVILRPRYLSPELKVLHRAATQDVRVLFSPPPQLQTFDDDPWFIQRIRTSRLLERSLQTAPLFPADDSNTIRLHTGKILHCLDRWALIQRVARVLRQYLSVMCTLDLQDHRAWTQKDEMLHSIKKDQDFLMTHKKNKAYQGHKQGLSYNPTLKKSWRHILHAQRVCRVAPRPERRLSESQARDTLERNLLAAFEQAIPKGTATAQDRRSAVAELLFHVGVEKDKKGDASPIEERIEGRIRKRLSRADARSTAG